MLGFVVFPACARQCGGNDLLLHFFFQHHPILKLKPTCMYFCFVLFFPAVAASILGIKVFSAICWNTNN